MAIIAAGMAAAACADAPTAQDYSPVVTPTAGGAAVLRGNVNLATGTMTFAAPRTPGNTNGPSTQIYGTQNVNVRLYNSPIQIDSITTPGVKRVTTMVGIRNLLNHSIGDEQAGSAPPDTMGIYVFFSTEPTVSAPVPCAGCTAAIKNHHGTLAFTGLNQKYFHWQERLGAAGSSTDTTRNRKLWTFEASAAVTNFTFTVLVSAGWPPPQETAWRIEFSGDSLPDTQAEPRWRRVVSGSGASATAGAGTLAINLVNPPDNVNLYFQRRDSLKSTTNAFAEARFRLTSGTGDAHTGFGFDDNTKFIQMAVSTIEAGFIDDGYGFIQKVAVTTGSFHVYRIRKFGADSVQLWIDGTRRLSVMNNDFPSNSSGGSIPSFFRFGSHGKGAVGNTSVWDYVIYNIGSSTP